MLDISIPTTIKHPARPYLYGATLPESSEEVTVVLHISPDTQSEIAAILGGPPTTALTPTALAAQYSTQELSTALQIALSK